MSMPETVTTPVISIHKNKENQIAYEAGEWKRVFSTEGVHPFDEITWVKTNAEIRGPDGKVVFEQKDIEVPSWWNQNTINVVADKYFRFINGVKENSVKQMFERVASTLTNWAKEQNYFNTDKDAQIYKDELLYALVHQYGAFNSPVWFNIGVPNRKQAASACFISNVEDSLDGIIDFQKSEISIFRNGSGSGVSLSSLRSSHEKIEAGSFTSGPISWMSGSDQYAGAMKSGGATRNAAKMVVLDMDHPDILETRDKRPGFIRCKAAEEKLAHDLVKIGYSVSYDDPNGAYKRVRFQNANHSVSVPDSFMQAVIDDSSWNTKERLTGKTVHKYKARDLWREIAEAAWICGDPGIQFTDTINKWHTTPNSGRINASNPCFHPDTRIATEHGLIRIEDLCFEFESNDANSPTFKTLVQTSDGPKLNGAIVFPTGIKNVVEVHTRRGRVIKVTPDHRLMTTEGWVEAGNLSSEDTLCIQAGEGSFSETGVESYLQDEALSAFTASNDRLMWLKIAGWIVGDGWILDRSPKQNTYEVGMVFGKDDKDVLETISNFLKENDINFSLKRQTGSVGESPDYMRIHRKAIWKLMSSLASNPGSKAPTKKVLESIFQSTKAEQLSFLSGLFSADGTFNIQPKKNIDARLNSSSLELLRGVQALLLNLGVNSTIYQDRRSGENSSPFFYVSKSGEVRTYFSKEKSHDLIITGKSLRTFKTLMLSVGFLSKRKEAKFNDIPDEVNNYGHDRWTDEVVKVVDNNESVMVYDITEPETSSLIANGIVAHNCSEYLNIDNTACNLCALNLTKFYDANNKFVYDRFDHAVRVFSTAQMAIIAKADYPSDSITKNSHRNRPIGTNYGDLGALLMKLGYGYDSDKGRAVAARLASIMTSSVYITAAKLAARVGAFEDFSKNRDEMLNVMRMHQEADAKITSRWGGEDPMDSDTISKSAEAWKEVISLGEKFGYNVSQASLQAPLGTISFLMGMNTTGVEPAISLVSYKSLVGGGYMKLVNKVVDEALSNLGYSQDQVTEIVKFINDNDTIEGAPHLKDEDLPVFDCALAPANGKRFLSPMAHIKMMAAIQPLITCAISKTVNLPNSVTIDDIADVYAESWKLGIKCIALYRDGCKASQPLSTKAEKEKTEEVKETPTVSIPIAPPVVKEVQVTKREKLPNDVSGWRHKFNIDGYKGYIVVNEYPDGRPGEIFLKLGKPGSTVSGLIDGYTQLLSIALQYGVPLPKLIASFIDTKFEPAGMTDNKEIRFAKSIYDYLYKVLDVRYFGGEHSGLKERIESIRETVNEGISKSPESDSEIPVAEVKTPKKSIDSPPCNKCGSITHRNGSCYLCSNCGTTTGCSLC